MITGDHKDTAVAIAKQLGIIENAGQAITGADLDEIGDEELEQEIENYSVYARVQPEHKVRIVKAWKKKGKITAMTGDGVKDVYKRQVQDGERIALRKRPERGLLAGMYEFPNLPGGLSREEILGWVRERGMTPLHIQKLDHAKHIFSHVEWHMTGYAVRVASFEGAQAGELILADVARAEKEYPVPSAYRAYARYMNLKLGQKEKNQQRKRK